MFLFRERESVKECEDRAERVLQVIILHTLVILGSARVPPLCFTINSLGGSEGEEERQRGGEGKRQSEKVGGSLYSALII